MEGNREDGQRPLGSFEPTANEAYIVQLKGTFKNVSALKDPSNRIEYRFPGGWLCTLKLAKLKQDQSPTLYLWHQVTQTVETGSYEIKCSCSLGSLSIRQLKAYLRRSRTRRMTWTKREPLWFKLGQADNALGAIKTHGDELRIDVTITSTNDWEPLPNRRTVEDFAIQQLDSSIRVQDVRIEFESSSTSIRTSSALLKKIGYFRTLLEQQNAPLSAASKPLEEHAMPQTSRELRSSKRKRLDSVDGDKEVQADETRLLTVRMVDEDYESLSQDSDAELEVNEDTTRPNNDAHIEKPAYVIKIQGACAITFRAVLDFLESGSIAFAPLQSVFEASEPSAEPINSTQRARRAFNRMNRIVYGFALPAWRLCEASPKRVYSLAHRIAFFGLKEVAKRQYISSLSPAIFTKEVQCGLVRGSEDLQSAMAQYFGQNSEQIYAREDFRTAFKDGGLPATISQAIFDAAAAGAK